MSLPGGAPSFVTAFKFDSTLGAILIGGLLGMTLWGITCVQTYTFFTQTSRDTPTFRALIAFLWMLDTFDSAMNCHFLYYYLVTNYTNPLAILTSPWSGVAHVAITTISNFIIRSMFARRIYRFSGRNYILTLWLVLVSLTDLACGFYLTAQASDIHSVLQLKAISTFFYLNFAAGTTSDLSIAFSLCYLLHKSRTGFQRSDSLIKVLMMYTVNTGLIVGLDAAAGLTAYIVMPYNFVFMAFYWVLSRLYLNSYLATLNARETLQLGPPSIHLSSITVTQTRSRYGQEVSAPSTLVEMRNRADAMPSLENVMVEQKIKEDHEPRAI